MRSGVYERPERGIKTPEEKQVKKSGVYERPERVIKTPEKNQVVRSGVYGAPGTRDKGAGGETSCEIRGY